MSDPHIDIDDADAPVSSSTTEQVFDDYDSGEDDSSNLFGLWGIARMPEMVRDVSDRLGVRMRESTDELIPEDARRLFRNAQREFLMGTRKLIDYQLEKLKAQEDFERSRRARDAAVNENTDTIKIQVEEDED